MGEATAIQAAITAQTSEWEKLLHVVTTIEDAPVYPTFLAIKLAFNPLTRFGHHFGNQPITLTGEIAKSTSRTCSTNTMTVAHGNIKYCTQIASFVVFSSIFRCFVSDLWRATTFES